MLGDGQATSAWCRRQELFSVLPLSRMSVVKTLFGVFKEYITNYNYNFFKDFKALIIEAEAILYEDLLANARGTSCLCLEHTIEAGIIWI